MQKIQYDFICLFVTPGFVTGNRYGKSKSECQWSSETVSDISGVSGQTAYKVSVRWLQLSSIEWDQGQD